MRERAGLVRRVGTVVRWPLGMALASWRYLWRTSPMYRFDEQGAPDDTGPPLPTELVDEHVQGVEDGVGPLFRRRYSVRIEGSSMIPEQLIANIAENPNRAAPVEVAIFRKTRGDDGPLQVGDEYLVRMPGPWDGPIRAVERTPTSFRLATLRGHLEAGQIEFRAYKEDAALRFEIESWARSGDWLSQLLYDRVRLVKEMQLHMWIHFCERVGRLAGGRVRGGVQVHTRRLQELPRG
jgi:Domain of unknown function (DUF1990)